MTLPLPQYPTGPGDIERVAGALFEHDQWDDWLPDALYWQDRRNAIGEVAAELRRQWAGATLPTPQPELLELPREGGARVPAAALPLLTRLCAHVVAYQAAPRLNDSLPRDKVYGFRFLREGAKVFDAPGDELELVFKTLADAAGALADDRFEMLDVSGFNAAARAATLATTLQRCGARADEAQFLAALAAAPGGALASIDDAFAFVYNFYLQPVDAALVALKRNFFRYRDEYYVFDATTRSAVESGLAKLSLRLRRTQVLQVRRPAPSDSQPDDSVTMFKLPRGELISSQRCVGPKDARCTDISEILYRVERVLPADLFKRTPQQPIDAVDGLPMLRELHRQRSTGALLVPPFAADTTSSSRYRSQVLRGARGWLQSVLRTALASGLSWQASWAAPLLSDIGILSDGESALLLQLAGHSRIDPAARMACVVALARSSVLPPPAYMRLAVSGSEYRGRALLLAARFAARRDPAQWPAAVTAVGSAEPALVRHLTANVPIAS